MVKAQTHKTCIAKHRERRHFIREFSGVTRQVIRRQDCGGEGIIGVGQIFSGQQTTALFHEPAIRPKKEHADDVGLGGRDKFIRAGPC